MPKGGFKREKTTGEWVRDRLERGPDAYVKELHNGFTAWCEERGYTPPSYDSFRRTIWLLKELGLVEVARTEPGDNPALPDRRYYTVRSGARRDHPGWRDPVREKYGRGDE